MFNQLFNRAPMYQPFAGSLAPLAKHGVNWSGLLSGTQKTLNIINQAIPVFYQVKPIWNNAKTMFRVLGEMGKLNNNRSNTDTSTNTTTVNNETSQSESQNNGPRFFI
jgi:hypothetical protein